MGKQQTDGWLERVYNATDRDSLRAMYDSWAETYDADLQQVGYLHLPVIVGLVAAHVPSREATILDAGVGTGAVGNVLPLLGYNNLSGIDMSKGMLEKAEARGCYSDLRQAVLGETLDFPDGAFDAILSTGTFTNGHAPAAAFHELTRILEPGGVLLVSAEDDPETVLRPRLDSHDANVSRVYLLRAVHRVQDGRIRRGVFTLADLPALESALRRVTDPKLCIIDPIGSFLGGNVDAHRDNEVREVLAPISTSSPISTPDIWGTFTCLPCTIL